MRNTIPFYRSPQNPKFIGGLFLVIAFVILFAALHSCNPVKIAARKDVAAVDRVKGSRNLINQIAPIVNDLFPCNRDTVIKIKSDTLIHYDTTQNFYHYEDSVYKVDTLLIKIKETRTIHDTVKLFTDSEQRSMIDGQTIANLNTLLSAANQSVLDSDKEAQDKGKWLWWFIGACVLLGVSWGLFIYLKLKI